jgi:tRNA dimethylallyltransferase
MATPGNRVSIRRYNVLVPSGESQSSAEVALNRTGAPDIDPPGTRRLNHGSAASEARPIPLLASDPRGRVLKSSALLVVVLGPTGSGKTALSLALAEHFDGEIVNCDSVAMYREFEIGTARPSLAERARVPHHLLDFVDPTACMTAGDYARQARVLLEEIRSRGSLPIVVGGTGLYLRALLEGLFPGPQRSEELRKRLRQRAQKKGSTYLHRVLRRLDAAAARRIHANDTPKLIRAVEVCLSSRQPMTEGWKQGRTSLEGFRVVRLGLNPGRDPLYERINRRAQQMFAAGLIEETERLLAKYGDAAWPLRSLGYQQVVQLLRGQMESGTVLQAVQQAHRNYAKRQMTWFRREPEVLWLPGFGDDPEIQRQGLARVTALQDRR